MTRGKRPLSCKITGQVAFYDLDPQQVVWHGNYFHYFEDARRTLLARNGIDLNEIAQRTGYCFPIIKTSTRYVHPLRYADVFTCKATLAAARTSLVVDFEIRLKDSGMLCAQGRTEQVAVKAPEMEMSLILPEEIRNAVGG